MSAVEIEDTEKAPAKGGRRPFHRRRKSCPLSGKNAQKIDYKDVKLLGRFVSERGKIMPSRITADGGIYKYKNIITDKNKF